MAITRRTFLRATSLTAASLPFARFTGAAQHAKNRATIPHVATGQKVHSVCGLCRANCLINGIVHQGRVIKIDGNPNDLSTDGKICARGKAAASLLYDPDRLKYPLKRIGERGEGKWTRISWGEAIDTISHHLENALKSVGPQNLALFHNGPSSHFIKELFTDLGCQNINNPSQEFCQVNRELAHGLTFGDPFYDPSFVKEQVQCLVLMGTSLGENVHVPQLRKYSKALANGAKLIVVDPRFSAAAAKADYHLMIRPGTDTALLLGWLHYIIDKGLFNAEIIRNISGIEIFKEQLEQLSLKEISEITDIRVSDIKRTAEIIAGASPAISFNPGQKTSRYGNDVQRLRAHAFFTALLKGNTYFDSKAQKNGQLTQIFPDRQQFGSSILRKMLQDEIKYVCCWGQNPIQAHPNPYRTITALKKADFVFCCDLYPGETALYSDIILPEASFLERADMVETKLMDGKIVATVRQPVIEPRFEARDPYSIVKQISSRMGRGKKFGFESIQDRNIHELKQLGVSISELQQKGYALVKKGETDSDQSNQVSGNKPEITFFSNQLLERGHKPLPLFEPVALPPGGYSRLLTGRLPVHSLSSTTNNPWLKNEIPINELWLNDRVAKKMTIQEGDELFLENQDGIRSSNPVVIKITPGIRVDCVYMAHGFGSKSQHLRHAFNYGVSDTSMMTRSVPDSISGVRGTHGNFIRFVKHGKTLSIPQLDNPPEILQETRKWWLDHFGSYENGSQRKLYV